MGNTDIRGVPTSCGDAELVARFDRLHLDSLIFQGDPAGDMSRLLKNHPDFVIGQCFFAGMLTQAMEVRVQQELKSAVAAADSRWAQANDRERGHIQALKHWIDGDYYRAVKAWEAVLVSYPHDLLALQLVHLSNVLLGDIAGQRACVERVFHHWDETVPGYEFVLGFYAFGLEETGDYALAEEVGYEATERLPDHPYAIHSVAHVLEMQGRQADGIAYVNERIDDWAHSGFANHMWWHLALFHLDLGEYDRVLQIYDDHLRTASPEHETYEEIDSSALLWRLKLLNIDAGSRWKELADKWTPAAEDSLYAFNDVHAMMAFASDGRHEEALKLIRANDRLVSESTSTNTVMSSTVGLPTCQAILCFARGEYGAAVDLLERVRHTHHVLGGSHAQRDIVEWTLIEASLRAGRHERAAALAKARCSAKSSSPQNWALLQRAMAGLGKRDEVKRATDRIGALQQMS